jgi:hypothetical protein
MFIGNTRKPPQAKEARYGASNSLEAKHRARFSLARRKIGVVGYIAFPRKGLIPKCKTRNTT